MATKSNFMARFEKSGADKEPKGVKEGSKADLKLDKVQAKKAAPFKKK